MRTPFYGGFGLVAADNIPKPVAQHLPLAAQAGRRAHCISTPTRRSRPNRRPGGALRSRCGTMRRPTARGQRTRCPPDPRARQRHLTSTLEERCVLTPRSKSGASTTTTATSSKPSTPWAARRGDLTQDQIAKLRAAGAMAPPEHIASQTMANSILRFQPMGWPSSLWSDDSSNGCDGSPTRSETPGSRRRAASADHASALRKRYRLARSRSAAYKPHTKTSCSSMISSAVRACSSWSKPAQIRVRCLIARRLSIRREFATAAGWRRLQQPASGSPRCALPIVAAIFHTRPCWTRVRNTLRFHRDKLENNHGFFSHFNDVETGARIAVARFRLSTRRCCSAAC